MASKGTVPTTRLNLEVGPKAKENLVKVSQETEQSLSETIRGALALYVTLWNELKTGRKRLLVQGDDGTEKEILLPGFQS